jgi:pyruvate ferredoxin oxidoreductase beta subunit
MTKPAPINAKNLTEEEYFLGHKACAGCGGSIAVRLALKVLGPDTFSVLPAGCMAAVGFIYPQMAFTRNAIISTFPGAASMASGVAVATRALGLRPSHTIVFAGDGGTADIGLQALSGVIDRGDRVIYVCYDNEAYMNTGIQKSGLTPYGSRTTTTPAGKHQPGSITHKKNLFEIIAAHDIPYAATASIGYPQDYMKKIQKASQVDGPSFIHILASCPTGWGSAADSAVELAKEAVTSGLWIMAEYEGGDYRLTVNPKVFSPIADYLGKQKRFAHLDQAGIEEICGHRDRQWQRIRKNWSV